LFFYKVNFCHSNNWMTARKLNPLVSCFIWWPGFARTLMHQVDYATGITHISF